MCEREFKELEPPDEDESWRELYFVKIFLKPIYLKILLNNKEKKF